MLINITVEEKRAAVIGTPIIICGNSDYSIEFSFDEEWAQMEAKTARFVYVQNGAVKHEDRIFTGNTVAVPVLINTRWVRVGVFAGDLRTTTPATIPCSPSIICSGGVVPDPTPDQYNQIIALLGGNSNDWEVINTITFTEEGITAFTIDRDKNGNSFELCDMIIRTDTPQVSLGGSISMTSMVQLQLNGKVVVDYMSALSSSERYWRAIATVINNRVWFGWTTFANQDLHNKGITLTALQGMDGVLQNDNAITSVGVNIVDPQLMYFAVGYTLTLYGRRKK